MNGKGVSEGTDRRQLLTQLLPAGAFACLFCPRGFAAAIEQATGATSPVGQRSQEQCGMSYEELFKFAYGKSMIPMMKAMAADVGREKLVKMLTKASGVVAQQGMREQLKKNPKNDFATFAAQMRERNPLYDHALTFNIIEDTPTAVAVRVNECLWAKTFRDADAADIGFASVCHPDVAAAPAYNAKLKLVRTKTLMQGDDCCNPRWTMET